MMEAFSNLHIQTPADLSETNEGPEWQASMALWNAAWDYAWDHPLAEWGLPEYEWVRK
jgi:hypothetical protein